MNIDNELAVGLKRLPGCPSIEQMKEAIEKAKLHSPLIRNVHNQAFHGAMPPKQFYILLAYEALCLYQEAAERVMNMARLNTGPAMTIRVSDLSPDLWAKFEKQVKDAPLVLMDADEPLIVAEKPAQIPASDDMTDAEFKSWFEPGPAELAEAARFFWPNYDLKPLLQFQLTGWLGPAPLKPDPGMPL